MILKFVSRPGALVARACLAAALHAVVFAAPVPPPPAAPGMIEGRVLDAARGEYLENARVTIEGTALEAFTDAGGYFRLVNVPAGVAKLHVFFTGQAVSSDAVNVTAGETTAKDITFGSDAGKAAVGEPIKMSKFVVETSKEMDGAAIAINEQRAAPNIKNVVTADEFGTIADGTPGEAIKFLPGVILTYSAGEAREVSINGVPTANVPVTVGGFDLASNAGGGTGRMVNFEQVSINNMSRIEVIQSPTPESQGSALAGSVNMVPRSAFERSHPSISYSVYEMLKDSDKHYDKTPGPFRDDYRKITPGFQFNLIMPVNKRFGFTFSANGATQFAPDDVITLKWRPVKDVTNGGLFPTTTPDKPYLTDVEVQDDLRLNKTTSASVTFDYKLTPHDTLSLSSLYTYLTVDHNSRTLSYFITGVQPNGFSTGFTHGSAGNGVLQLSDTNTRYWLGTTSITTLVYRHDGGLWKAESGAATSYAGQHNRDISRGILRNSTARRSGLTISYDDIFYLRPGRITVTDSTGAAVDPYRLDNYVITAANYQNDNWLTFRNTAYANLQRDFTMRDVPVMLKAGLDFRELTRDIRGPQTALTPSPAPNQASPAGSAYNAGQFLDENLSQRTLPYGFGRLQAVDDSKLYRYYVDHPSYFTTNANTIYTSQVNVSKWMQEAISSAYVRSDVAFFDRRLQFVGGFRAEQTNAKGEGSLSDPTRNFQRDASGKIIDGNPNLAGVQPSLIVPASNALGVSQLTLIERGNVTNKEYLRVLPNINATYAFRENLRLQTAFYYSLGRPDYSQYAGALTLPDTDLGPTVSNTIKVNNAGIKAWSARTFKVRLEYFFQGVGEFSIGAYQRDFKDFFGSTVFAATPDFLQLYNLDPNIYNGYYVSTNYNIPGTIHTNGVELSYKQALTFLPHWARGVQVFANANTQRITGDPTGAANFNASFIPRSGSWGISLSRPSYTLRANWNYRGLQRRAAVTGVGIEPGTFTYNSARMYLDLSGEYYLNRRVGFFVNLRNFTDATEDAKVYGPSTPSVARFSQRNDYSAFWTVGLKGTF